MFLPPSLLFLLLPPSTASPPTHTTTLSFDTLTPPPHGLSPLPPLPSTIPLLFSPRFSLFNPTSPALANYISPHDKNCAFSPPNALLGSRACEGCEGASFEIDRKKGEGKGGFELVGMRVKTMAAPPGGTRLWIRGWRVDGDKEGEVLEWSVVFPYGFWDMFEVRIEEFSGRKWDGLWKVEVSARYGVDGLDWEVCVDDLVVGFEGWDDDGEGGVEEL